MFNSKDMLVLSILTVITVMTWIAFDVYHAATTSTITDVESSLIVPLSPGVDIDLLNQIQSRQIPQ